MKIIDLEPSSPEWLMWRQEGIGASDIGVIMGSNPYRTPYQLWEEKMGFGKPIEVNHAMKHGIENEAHVRDIIAGHLGCPLRPMCCEDDEHSIFKASLDGWNDDTRIAVEVKCPLSVNTIENARNACAVHSHWVDQIQWQMMITQAHRGYIAVYDYRIDSCILLEQFADGDRQALMREKALEFWESVRYATPPEFVEKDLPAISNPELEHLLRRYQEFDEEEKRAKASKNLLRNEILSFAEGSGFRCSDYVIARIGGRASYDYKRMQEDGIDIDKYKKTGEPGYRISQIKSKEGTT